MAKPQVFPATPYYQQDFVPYGTSLYKTSASPPPAGLIFEDDFTNFQPTVPQAGGEFTWSSTNGTSQAVDPQDAGNQTLQFDYYLTDSIYAQSEQRYALGSLHQEIWLRYRILVPSNYIHKTHPTFSTNNKGFFNLWGDTYTGQDVAMRIEFERKSDTESRIVMYSKQGQTGSSTQINGSTDSDGRLATDLICIGPADLGNYIEIVVQARISDKLPTTDGRCRMWKNGTLFCDYRNVDNSSADGTSSNAFNGGYILGYANSGFTVMPTFNLDDFKIGTSAASIGFTVP